MAAATPWHERLRDAPFPIFFGLGLLFAWIGVSHWILYATGLAAGYSGTTHANLQMQCFELSFASGFLFTALPKRTRSRPASWPELGSSMLGLLFGAVSSLADRPQLAAGGYVLALGTLGAFAVRRLIPGGLAARRPPASFVLIPFGLLMGLTGGVMSMELFPLAPWMVMLATDLVRQGLFFCLILGAGGLIIPLVLGTGAPPDITAASRPRLWALGVLGVAIATTFVLEHRFQLPHALLLRGLLVLGGLLAVAGIHHRPRVPGVQRRVAWVATWMVPLGAILGGALPDYRVALLHLTFVGGFGLLSFAVASHVALGHTDREQLRDSARAPVLAYAGLMLLAALTRVICDFLLDSYFRHLAYAASVWMLGSLAWLYLLTRRARPAQ